MAVDTSFSTFLKETGKADFFRTGLFRRKRSKTLSNAPASEIAEYAAWKREKNKQEALQQQVDVTSQLNLENQFQGFDKIVLNILNTPSARELQNKKILEQIERINAVDLSIDTTNYIGDNDIESRYPGLVDSVASQLASYGNSFREDETYAQTVVTNTINTKPEILEHIRWMILPPNNVADVDLRDVNLMGSWVLQTTPDVGMGAGGENTNLSVKSVEQPKPIAPKIQPTPIKIPINQIQKDAKIISQSKLIPFDLNYVSYSGRGVSGESEKGNIILRRSGQVFNNNFDNSAGSRSKTNTFEL